MFYHSHYIKISEQYNLAKLLINISQNQVLVKTSLQQGVKKSSSQVGLKTIFSV